MLQGMVEKWLAQVELGMLASLKDVVGKSMKSYPTLPRTEYVLGWPGQVVLCVCSIFWTAEVAESLQNKILTVNTRIIFPPLIKMIFHKFHLQVNN